MADEMKLPDEDDFTHYFNATGRLSKENAALRAEVESLRTEIARKGVEALNQRERAEKAEVERDAALKERDEARLEAANEAQEHADVAKWARELQAERDAALSRAEAAEQIAREACGWPGRESPPSGTWVEELAGFLRVTRGQRDSNRELLIDAEARLRDVQEALRSVEESCRVALHRLG